jgi:asparagine synthase (glutamine-hydrolysing)
MCGITGFLSPAGFPFVEANATLANMRDRLHHRGPDDAGSWLDAEAGIALGHRRLSILDLSLAGHQPMVSGSGRYVLAFNGEIYNHLEIRQQLDAAGKVSWRGHSDTESLLVAIQCWGLERTLKALVGMFAIALWDQEKRTLSLARDRMGEKPLYYGWQGDKFLFGSELKALRAHPAFESEIDRDVLPLYLRHGYIPAPWSVWRGIRKLTPGTWITVRASDRNSESVPQSYWSFYEAALQGQADLFAGSDQEAIDALEATLKQAVAGQMVADVPLGAFLSGGIDSSVVVGLMQAQSSQRVKTFTIGFAEAGYNEAVQAKAVAAHLGTDHTEIYVTADQTREVIPRLSQMYDEPFGDSSAIPTSLVSQLARQHVTISLSGDGGDELFGGYGRYFNAKAEANWKSGRSIPGFARSMAASALRSKAPVYANAALHQLSEFIGRPIGKSVAARCKLMAALMQSATHSEYYRVMTSQWNPVPVVKSAVALDYGLATQQMNAFQNPVEQMMAQDSVTYLPDDILVKVDRAGMAVSLENRVPMLDHRVVELAWRIPHRLKVRDGQGKWLLRQVLYRHVPQELIDRPKMGFGAPVDQWLRGPLREWGEELLGKQRLEEEGYLDATAVQDRWNDHLRGRHNWRDSLWLVLMWQAWLESLTK